MSLETSHTLVYVLFHVLFLVAGPKLVTYVSKVIAQCFQLLYVLLKMELQAFILMQVRVISN